MNCKAGILQEEVGKNILFIILIILVALAAGVYILSKLIG